MPASDLIAVAVSLPNMSRFYSGGAGGTSHQSSCFYHRRQKRLDARSRLEEVDGRVAGNRGGQGFPSPCRSKCAHVPEWQKGKGLSCCADDASHRAEVIRAVIHRLFIPLPLLDVGHDSPSSTLLTHSQIFEITNIIVYFWPP